MASVIYAGRGARNRRGVHSIRLIHDYSNQDGNSWGSQEASPKTEAPLAVAKLSERCRASRYLSEVMNVCYTSALNERVPPSQARSVAAQPSLPPALPARTRATGLSQLPLCSPGIPAIASRLTSTALQVRLGMRVPAAPAVARCATRRGSRGPMGRVRPRPHRRTPVQPAHAADPP